ncbi:NitT/TauT family transport system substrate-binding protein [Phyllobacterium sp. 1468]|uniref:ABC transporter substrate-binding protein n=1 Tax=Phyllobacterium sp. 1468 TaxID=2817759 RepID=UPI0028631111|nr:ABC transporter substrate-binding protein [Phyllobacterium sp. 1468]MDR6635466.1 NitT/TauT family transport system substrate-binding protein [Phyllobacterium sp. 1468]
MTAASRFLLILVAMASAVGASRAEDLTRIDVALGDVSLNKVAFLVAADNEIYAKYDLNIHQFITENVASRISRSGINAPQSFIGTDEEDERAPISIGGGSPLIVSMTTDARSTDRVIIATTDSTARFHIIASKALSSVDDLKGKRLGYSSYGSVSHLMALAFLRQKGWSADDDISLMGEGMAYSALKEGKVDAFIGSEIYYTMADKNGARDLVNLTDYKIPLAGSGINVERKWLAANRDSVMRFVKATVEAYAPMKSDENVVRAALAKWYGIYDTKQEDDMYAQVVASPKKPYPAVDGIKLVKNLFNHREMRRYEAEHFYDASFVTELDKGGFIDALYNK